MLQKRQSTTIRFNIKDKSPIDLKSIGYADWNQSFRFEQTSPTHREKQSMLALRFLRTQTGCTIHFVQSGKGTLYIRGKTYPLNPGDLFFIPPNEPMMYYKDNEDPFSYFWFFFSETEYDFLTSTFGFTDSLPILRARSPEQISLIFENLFSQERSFPELYYLALSAFMQITAMTVSESYTVSSAKHKDAVNAAKEIIKLNFTNPDFSVDLLPQMIHISRSHLCRLFKANEGITPISYLVKLRLDYAGELLQSHAYSIKELCERTGFSDITHFSKQFKSNFGVTVKKYRNIYNKSDKAIR